MMAALAARALLLIAIFGYLGVRVSGECNMTALTSSLDLALAEYDREAAPSAPLLVQLALELHHAAVDDRAGTVRLLADLHHKWHDARLTWNVSEWGCSQALVAAERLWLPDVEPWGAGAAAEPQRARLAADGTVTWQARFDVTMPLEIDLADWPNDRQLVSFNFASRQHPIDEIDLGIFDQPALVFDGSGWETVSLVGQTGTTPRADQGTWRVATWEMSIRRRAAAHVAAARALLAAALLLLAAAALPPDRRAPLAATASLLAAIWLTSSLSRLPGGRGAPRCVSLLCVVCACGGALCACAALLRRVARLTLPPPAALRTLLNKCKLTPLEGAGGAGGAAWAAAAQLLDYALLAAAALALLIATATLAV